MMIKKFILLLRENIKSNYTLILLLNWVNFLVRHFLASGMRDFYPHSPNLMMGSQADIGETCRLGRRLSLVENQAAFASDEGASTAGPSAEVPSMVWRMRMVTPRASTSDSR